MLLRTLKASLRHFVNDKTNTLIKLAGMAIGLSIASIILIYSSNELSYDKFHANGDRIYQMVDSCNAYGVIWASAPFVAGPDLKREFPEVEDYAHLYHVSDFSIKKGASSFDEKDMIFTESSFFDIFSFELLSGSADALDESPNAIILSESKARKYFGNQNPVGEILQLEMHDSLLMMNVCGVMRDFPNNSSIKANMVASIDLSFWELSHSMINAGGTAPTKEQLRTGWRYSMFFVNYLLLSENTDVEVFRKKMTAYTERHSEDLMVSHLSMVPFSDVYFNSGNLSNNYSPERGNKEMILVLSLVGLIILIVALINYFNISMAQLFVKKRAIAIYNVCGASRGNIVRQLMTESVLFALITLPVALVVAQMCLPYISRLLEKKYELQLFDSILGLPLILGVTIVSGALSGFVISIKATSQRAIDAIRNMNNNKQRLMPSKIMLSFQLVALIVLIVSVFGIYKQVNYSINKNLGFNKENLLVVKFTQQDKGPAYEVFKQRIQSNSDILNVSGAMWLPPTTNNMIMNTKRVDDPDATVNLFGLYADYNFIETMGFELVKGSSFKTDGATTGVIVNEMAIEKLGLTTAIGENIGFGEVQGVIKDFHYASVRNHMVPTMIVLNTDMVGEMVIRTAPGKTIDVLNYLKDEWASFNTDAPFRFEFFDNKVQKLYDSDVRMALVISGFAILAIVIAVLGLVGLSLFTTRQRIKEIGIRKVNGAKVSEILSLLNKDFIWWVSLAFIIACPIAWYAMDKWLANFAYRTSMSWWIFVLGGICALGITMLTVSWQTWRAARKNPVEALRYE
jgi:putative ABC transport system permease protein